VGPRAGLDRGGKFGKFVSCGTRVFNCSKRSKTKHSGYIYHRLENAVHIHIEIYLWALLSQFNVQSS